MEKQELDLDEVEATPEWRQEKEDESSGGPSISKDSTSPVDRSEGESKETAGVLGHGVGAIGRVLSRVTSRSSVHPGPPPDGGWPAWTMGTSL